MRELIAGIAEFREKLLPRYAERFRALALGQSPDTLMITCSDSRVVPDLLASTHPGDLFTMRNVGNLVPPADAEGISTSDVSEASAIEYAVLVLGVRNIVVCGHSSCGAMKAALAQKVQADTPNLAKWLHHASAACSRLTHEGALTARYRRPTFSDQCRGSAGAFTHLQHCSGESGEKDFASSWVVVRRCYRRHVLV
jgi:carbonic anhydrase